MSAVPWLDYLIGHIGLREIPGPEHEPLIVKWGQAAGISWWNNDEDAWCAVAVNGALVESGYPSTRSALARSFLEYGEELDKPVRGAIVVFPRGNNELYGHVGIVEDVHNDGTMTIVNGNVSNMVRRSRFRTDAILPGGIRWPKKHQPREYDLGKRQLSIGFRGKDVRELQILLNVLNHGLEVDGIYGRKTARAVKFHQEVNGLTVDAIAGPATISSIQTKAGKRLDNKDKEKSATGGLATGAGAAGAAAIAIDTVGKAQDLNDGTVFGLVLAILSICCLVGFWYWWRVRDDVD